MQERFLNINEKIEFMDSGFHQSFIIKLNAEMESINETVNITLRLDEIGGTDNGHSWGLNKRIEYINEHYDNILFTPSNDFYTIYPYEFYKGIFYIKAKPFSSEIVLHILPKHCRASDKVLMFKDSDIDPKKHFIKTDDYYNRHTGNIINLYYQSIDLTNNTKQDRPSYAKPYPEFHKFGQGDYYKLYQKHNENNWITEDYPTVNKPFGEYEFDISSWAKNMQNIQINAGYQYNESSPTNAIHYTGIKDNTNTAIEDRAVLIDSNYDKITSKTNNIQQMEYYLDNGNKKIRFPESSINQKSFKSGFNNSHTPNKTFHKKIKYFNDFLYIEENNQYVLGEWKDPSI